MGQYAPAEPRASVPSSLEKLAKHPERGRWNAAILLYSTSRRWPRWAFEFALSTVDSDLQIRSAHFLVQPPFGWKEEEQENLPSDISPRRVASEGLFPSQAVWLLNEIFGNARVYSNDLMRWGDREKLEAAAGLRLTWRFAGAWDWLGEDLSVPLDEASHVAFYCRLPTEGGLAARAQSWAQSFAQASYAQKRLKNR